MAFCRKPVIVRQVFADELEHEFALIQRVILDYPLVSMDTEFPGTLFKPTKQIIYEDDPDVNYWFMKSNVDALNIIQLGLTLSDPQGNLPDFGTPNCYVWEFNFNDFDLDKDKCDKDSIELLKRQGIDFAKNKAKGIASRDFADMVLKSGFLYGPFGAVTWITYHGAYDFGFLVKILTQRPLPDGFDSFMNQLIKLFGTNIFDIKHTFKFFGFLGGLEKAATNLNVSRLAGSSHQAGSDSLLTLQCFMELNKSRVFETCQSRRMLPPLALYGLVSALE